MQHKNNLTIVVKVSSLISSIRANMDNHKSQVEKARAGFEKEAEETLQKSLEDLRSGKISRVYINLQGVDDHTKDYSRVIGMLQMHNQLTIELGAEDYARYVEDDWDWKTSWLAGCAKYLEAG